MTRNVLIVDDSPTMRKVIKKTFKLGKNHGYQIIEAPNGQEALDFIRNNNVSLLFLDLNMPCMDGLELVQVLDGEDLMERIPTIVVSSDRNSSRIEGLKSAGVDAYVSKPFTPERLQKVIDRVAGGI